MTAQPPVEGATKVGDTPFSAPNTILDALGENPQSTETNGAIDLDSMSLEELQNALSSDSALSEILNQSKPQPASAPEANAEQDDDGETEPSTADEAQPQKPKRIRMNVGDLPETDIDRIFQLRDMVKRGEATDVLDAMRKMAAPEAPAETPDTKADPTPQPEPSQKLQDLQQRIETLKQDRINARKVDFDFDKADAISDEIAVLTVELKEAEKEAENTLQTESLSAKEWESKQAESFEELKKAFPDLRDEASPLYEEYCAQHALAVTNEDPAFQNPDWPLVIAKRAQARLDRLTSKTPQAKTSSVRTSPPPPAPAKPSRPVGSLSGQGADGPPLSSTELSRLVESAPLDALQEALSAPNQEAAAAILMRRRK